MICLIDDGIAPDTLPHSFLAGGINFSDEGAEHQFQAGPHSHGTAMAQTLFETCPQGRVFVVRLLDRYGHLNDVERLAQVFDWLARQRAALGITLVCAPLADNALHMSDDAFRQTPLAEHVAQLRRAGVPTLMPAGNRNASASAIERPGMAWPAILRDVISVGALSGNHGHTLHATSKRLAASAGSPCATTLFAHPGEPGQTSGATARAAGLMAAMQLRYPGIDVQACLDHLRHPWTDQHGQCWPVLSDTKTPH